MISALLNWFQASDWPPLLCRLNCHHWGRYFTLSRSMREMFPDWEGAITRVCDKCGRMEMTLDEGKTWRQRL